VSQIHTLPYAEAHTRAVVETGQDARPSRSLGIIAVASGKGGVGKTWFSVTLATCLAKRGLKTLLFDGDLGLANVDIQLGLFPKRDLGHYFAGAHALAALQTSISSSACSPSATLATISRVRMRLPNARPIIRPAVSKFWPGARARAILPRCRSRVLRSSCAISTNSRPTTKQP